ncbi:MAG: DUF309 domain-containing protein [Haloferacaceae archaeon]
MRSTPDGTARSVDGVRAGAALLAAGQVDAARVAWARAGPQADPLVAGLVGYAAAVADGGARDWSRARARATLGRRALGRVADPSPIAVGPPRTYLGALADDPAVVERRPPPAVRVEGAVPDPDALPFEALARAARAVAATGALDSDVVDDAVRYAREEVATGTSAFAALLTDVAAGRETAMATRRLDQRVARRRSEERDVDGLFD